MSPPVIFRVWRSPGPRPGRAPPPGGPVLWGGRPGESGTLPLVAQESFYKGKTIRIIVGFPAGGGYDTYARLIARHMGKYIPANPTIIVENMTGAGSLISANHVYKVAKPDGLSIGHFIGGLFLQQLLG